MVYTTSLTTTRNVTKAYQHIIDRAETNGNNQEEQGGDANPVTSKLTTTLYAFFWVIPRRLNFICRHIRTLYSIFTGGQVFLHTYPPTKMEQCVPKRWHI
jgi:hypothetical protein